MNCEHKNTKIEHNVGWDIDETGEERQHLETCQDCGQQRLIIDRIPIDPNDRSPRTIKTQWSDRNKFYW
jgi:hypothetical protein